MISGTFGLWCVFSVESNFYRNGERCATDPPPEQQGTVARPAGSTGTARDASLPSIGAEPGVRNGERRLRGRSQSKSAGTRSVLAGVRNERATDDPSAKRITELFAGTRDFGAIRDSLVPCLLPRNVGRDKWSLRPLVVGNPAWRLRCALRMRSAERSHWLQIRSFFSPHNHYFIKALNLRNTHRAGWCIICYIKYHIFQCRLGSQSGIIGVLKCAKGFCLIPSRISYCWVLSIFEQMTRENDANERYTDAGSLRSRGALISRQADATLASIRQSFTLRHRRCDRWSARSSSFLFRSNSFRFPLFH